jgi:lysine 2,3-aminomutase
MSSSDDEPPSPLVSPSLIVDDKIISEHAYVRDLISPEDFDSVTRVFPFLTSAYYLSLSDRSRADPVMRQLCPSAEELKDDGPGHEDPLAEEKSSPLPGLVHRYPDRVLMIVTNVCFVNCRHCTRKRLWRQGRTVCSPSRIEQMIGYIREHKEIRDVILSGGDPLTLSNEGLEDVLSRIRAIPQVEIIRVGTRAPVVYPWRITKELAAILKKYRPLWLNTQFNHAREITLLSSSAVQKILEAGIPVNNQSVLLRGVNDTAQAMTDLCHGLLKIGVRPYYLFHCDPVAGTGHFRTSIKRGIEIIEKMRGHTSGLAVPTYVVDAVDGGGKIPLQPEYVRFNHGKKILLRNYQGRLFEYEETGE